MTKTLSKIRPARSPRKAAAAPSDSRFGPLPLDPFASQRLFQDDTVLRDDQGQILPDPFPTLLLSPLPSSE